MHGTLSGNVLVLDTSPGVHRLAPEQCKNVLNLLHVYKLKALLSSKVTKLCFLLVLCAMCVCVYVCVCVRAVCVCTRTHKVQSHLQGLVSTALYLFIYLLLYGVYAKGPQATGACSPKEKQTNKKRYINSIT